MDSSSPLTSIYHIAGIDDRDRGFNRQAHVTKGEVGFQARLRYELLQVEVDPVSSEDAALQRLIQVLHDRGYTQLRTQRIFVGEEYLGTQELWVEYSDPEVPTKPEKSWKKRLRQLLKKFSKS